MLKYVITLILCLVIIAGFHYFWNYFKNMYTPRIENDLASFQSKKFKTIMEDLNKSAIEHDSNLNNEEMQDINNDLNEFIKDQLLL